MGERPRTSTAAIVSEGPSKGMAAAPMASKRVILVEEKSIFVELMGGWMDILTLSSTQ